ncbi:MAG: lactonase family protein [Bifidobacterium breve]|nr:lactonase family protein [Bifidobacterium breve]
MILNAGGNASNDSDDAALLSRGRLLADVPSPTWMELHTAADGSQVLYAVLEDTNEIASFASRGGRLIAACGAVPRTHAGHAATHVVFVCDDEGQGRLITADYADGYVCVHPVTESG